LGKTLDFPFPPGGGESCRGVKSEKWQILWLDAEPSPKNRRKGGSYHLRGRGQACLDQEEGGMGKRTGEIILENQLDGIGKGGSKRKMCPRVK